MAIGRDESRPANPFAPANALIASSASCALSAWPARPARYLRSPIIPSSDLSRTTIVGSPALGVSARAGSTVPTRARKTATNERERIGKSPKQGKVESPDRGQSAVAVIPGCSRESVGDFPRCPIRQSLSAVRTGHEGRIDRQDRYGPQV